MRIVVVPMPENPTTTVLVLVETGSKYETKEKNGLAHFLEHMCFKGTTNRPNTSDLSIELDGLGCEYNAFTGQEYTGYFAKGKATDTKKILDILSDLYQNPLLQEDEIQKEKGVIVDEINMYEDLPTQKVYEIWMKLLYGDQPAGWPIAGTRELVRAMTRKDFVNYRADHYVAEATTIVIAGDIKKASIMKDVEKAFAHIHTGKKKSAKKTKVSQTSPRVACMYKEIDQTHCVLGVHTFPVGDKRNPALSLLGGILGSGMSSRLFRKLRDEMGVGYYVRAGNTASMDAGFFSIATGVANDRVHEVLAAIIKECMRLTEELVSEEELHKVKEHLVGTMYLGLESSDDLAEYYGVQEVLRRDLKTPKEKERMLRNVTAKEVRDIARRIFKDKHLNLALIGPFKKGEDFHEVLTFK